MANPVPGTLQDKFDRVYIVVNPDPTEGPPTYRVSNPDQIGQSGGAVAYTFEGQSPIEVDTLGSNNGSPNVVKTSMDIQDLESRTD